MINLPFYLKMAHKTYDLMCIQARYGVQFNVEKAKKLVIFIDKEMETIRAEVEPQLPPKAPNQGDQAKMRPPLKQFLKSGGPSSTCLKWFDEVAEDGSGEQVVWMGKKDGNWYTLPHHELILHDVPMSLSNQKELKEWLMDQGWVPTCFNYKQEKVHGKLVKVRDHHGKLIETSPKFQENGKLCPNLEGMDGAPLVKLVIKWLSLRNRRSVLSNDSKGTGLINNPRLAVDGRISATSAGLTNCVTGDTLIVTDNGYIPITKVKKGDLVLTHAGKYAPVTDTIFNGIKPVFRIRLGNGQEIKCTENHPIMTSYGWRKAGQLFRDISVKIYGGYEKWKQVYGFPGYLISSCGRIKGKFGDDLYTNRRCPLWERSVVELRNAAGKRVSKGIGELVLRAFDGARPDGKEVCHIDGNYCNNYNENLYWGTSKENSEDAKLHGKHLRAMRKKANSKLTHNDINDILIMALSGKYTNVDIARKYDISDSHVCNIKQGKVWDLSKNEENLYTERFKESIIISIDHTGYAPVYDITVKHDHSYVGNGFICHNTKRQKHRGLVNIPRPSSYLGAEFREIFEAPEGKKFVGYDAKGLEARIKGHYIYKFDQGAYANKILTGDYDEHQESGDLWFPDWVDRDAARRKAKNGDYALQYFCQPPTLAKTLGCSVPDAERYWEQYWELNWALGMFRDATEIEWMHNKKQFVYAIDKSKVMTRSKHSIVNCKIQSTGAKVVDLSGIYMDNWVKKRGIDAHRVLYYHDEYAWECRPEDAELIKWLGAKSMKQAGEYFKLNVPLDADGAIGMNWKDVH